MTMRHLARMTEDEVQDPDLPFKLTKQEGDR